MWGLETPSLLYTPLVPRTNDSIRRRQIGCWTSNGLRKSSFSHTKARSFGFILTSLSACSTVVAVLEPKPYCKGRPRTERAEIDPYKLVIKQKLRANNRITITTTTITIATLTENN